MIDIQEHFVPEKVASPALTDAEHDVALDDDHVNVTVIPVATEEDDALKLTVGAGLDGSREVTLLLPPPPPPQLTRMNVEVRIYIAVFLNMLSPKKITLTMHQHMWHQ